MVVKNQGVTPLLGELGEKASAAKTLCTTHIDDHILNISSIKINFLTIQAADAIVKNDDKPAPFHESSLCKNSRALRNELHVRHLEQHLEKFLLFVLFLDTRIQ